MTLGFWLLALVMAGAVRFVVVALILEACFKSYEEYWDGG
jgi:hypothetical protein